MPWPEVWKKHNSIIEMWHIARGTPTLNACIVEIAHALSFIDGTQRESLLDALGASTRSGLASGGRGRSIAATPHWDNDTKKLSYRNQTVREVMRPNQAHNIVKILQSFHNAGWVMIPLAVSRKMRHGDGVCTRRSTSRSKPGSVRVRDCRRYSALR